LHGLHSEAAAAGKPLRMHVYLFLEWQPAAP
jgi:hypothetical protein